MVDKSLSRGLADRVLDEMSGLSRAYSERCCAVFRDIPGKRHAIRRGAEALRIAGESCYLTQVVAAHPKHRWASTCAFVPEVLTGEGPNARELAFCTVRTYFHVDRVPLIVREGVHILAIHEHAVERMFLRLNVMDAADVREEIHDAVLLAPLLLPASRKAKRRQAVLPTRSGAFLCCVKEDGGLVAKTWVQPGDGPCRHAGPIATARQFLEQIGGELGIGRTVGEMPINFALDSLPAAEELADRLASVGWLAEPYAARQDPVGDVWRRAREQQLAA